MKKLLFSLVTFFVATSAFGAAATQYYCVGTDQVSGESVSFEVLFADSVFEVGYTNQSVTVTRIGYDVLEKPLALQMFGADEKNNCSQVDGLDEIYMNAAGWDMQPSEEWPGYVVTFKSDCADRKLDVKGLCLFE